MNGKPMRATHILPFGRRHIVPRICVVENKPHVRGFLAQAFEDLGFVTSECLRIELPAAIAEFAPDIVVAGPQGNESELALLLQMVSQHEHGGKVMLFGGRSSLTLIAAQDFGERLGLSMLPPLGTPFRDADLVANLAEYLPILPLPSIPVEAGEALSGGWIEPWYQPLIDARSLAPRGVAAVIRLRHPSWGIVPPASFIAEPDDPQLTRLSQSIVTRVLADWDAFIAVSPIELSLPLPLSALLADGFVDELFLALSDRALLSGFMVEIAADEAARDPLGFRRVADALAACRIRVGLAQVRGVHLPFLQDTACTVRRIKLDRTMPEHAVRDRRSRETCGRIVAHARTAGISTAADGIDNRTDLHLARDVGIDVLQGALLAPALDARRFLRVVNRQKPRQH
jgi:EAL domain-containing protein (putative c-di-GMP-specific phosphodiesterase class I)